jgi:hypothetical protein
MLLVGGEVEIKVGVGDLYVRLLGRNHEGRGEKQAM